MTAAPDTATLTAEQVLVEARRRIAPARDAATERGDHELAADLDELCDDITVENLELDDQDRAVPHLLAALMGITVRER